MSQVLSWAKYGLNFRQSDIIAFALIAMLAILPGLMVWTLPSTLALPPSEGGQYPFVIFSIAIALLLCLLRPLQLVCSRHPAPLRQIREDIINNRYWLLMVLAMLVLIPQTLDEATQIKRLIPEIQPFYADPIIISIEHAVLGTDAWRLTHAVFGRTATRFIDLIYGLWHLVNIAALCWMILTRNREFQFQAVLSYQLAWLVLGGILATAFSSVGPCFYELFTGSHRFAPLMTELRSVNGPEGLNSLVAMKYVFETRGTNAFGSGISAMPSLHVAIAVFVFLAFRYAWPKQRLLQTLVALYAITIFVGSVHLGWHYAVDGIVGGLGMVAIWKAVELWLAILDARYGDA
jgi:hypothetical protein